MAEDEAISTINKAIELKDKQVELLRKLQLNFMVKKAFPEQIDKSLFFVVNANYYRKHFLIEFRANNFDIKGLYGKLSKMDKVALEKTLVIYCIDTKQYVLVPSESQILEHSVIKFGGRSK